MEVVREIATASLPERLSTELTGLLEQFERTQSDSSGEAIIQRAMALEHLALQEQQPEIAARARLGLGRAYVKQGHFEGALAPLLLAAAQFEARGLHKPELEALMQLGQVYRHRAELEAAMRTLERALSLAIRLKDSTTAAQALNSLAGIHHVRGESAEALERLQTALGIQRQHHQYLAQAECLNNMGVLYIDQADYPSALECLFEARALLRDHVRDPRHEGNCLINIGYVYDDMKDHQQAAAIYAEALELADTHGDRSLKAMASVNLAVSRRHLGRLDDSLTLFQTALLEAREIGMRLVEIAALDGLGTVHTALGQSDAALEAHAAALHLARETEHRDQEIESLVNLARTHLSFARPEAALKVLESALPLAEMAELRKFVIEIHDLLATAFEGIGDLSATVHHLRLHHSLERALVSEEAERRTRHLKMSFELERARRDNEVMRRTNELLEENVSKRTEELEEARVEILTRLAVAAEYRDDSTGQHTSRVGTLAALIAERMGMPDDQVELLRFAARLHDVGKIGISDLLLMKPAKLSPEEFERVKEHTTIGAQILSGGKTPLLQLAEIVAESHHERWDGTGYPRRLQGEQIPLPGRIVAVADVFDALIHSRPYKDAWSEAEAMTEIERQAGTQFDPEVVKAFLEIMRERDDAI